MDEAKIRDCVSRLRARKEPAPLVPAGVWDPELNGAIERLLSDDQPLKSALFLWNDDLPRAHEIAQEIKTATGSYLHGVMHRREPDYENSKYWFHRVGDHPNFPAVRQAALALLKERVDSLEEVRKTIEESKKWDAFRMVDWCREAARRDADDSLVKFLRALQTREIELLVEENHKDTEARRKV